MPDYKTMYKRLFVAVTEAIDILQKAQQEAEEIYIESSENDDNKIVKPEDWQRGYIQQSLSAFHSSLFIK